MDDLNNNVNYNKSCINCDLLCNDYINLNKNNQKSGKNLSILYILKANNCKFYQNDENKYGD